MSKPFAIAFEIGARGGFAALQSDFAEDHHDDVVALRDGDCVVDGFFVAKVDEFGVLDDVARDAARERAFERAEGLRKENELLAEQDDEDLR